MKKIVKVIAALLATLALSLIFTICLHLRSVKVLKTWDQDKSIGYDGSGHSLAVIRTSRDWSLFELGWRYEIFTGKTVNVGSYGHGVPWEFGGLNSVEDQLQHARVEWKTDGVVFTDQNGQRLFIPKGLFMGGR